MDEIQKIYSVTLKRLSLSEPSKQALLRKFCLQFDHMSWFPAFLKELKTSPEVFQIAQVEWNLNESAENKNQDGICAPHEACEKSRESSQKNFRENLSLKLNPGAKFCHLDYLIPEFDLVPGLYVFCQGRALALNMEQAKILDQLEEGRVLTSNWVTAQGNHWEVLVEHGVILCSKSPFD